MPVGENAIGPTTVLMGHPILLQWGVEARLEGRDLSVCSAFLPLSMPNINDSYVSKEVFAPHCCSTAGTAWKWEVVFSSFSAGLREQRQHFFRKERGSKKPGHSCFVKWKRLVNHKAFTDNNDNNDPLKLINFRGWQCFNPLTRF